MNARVSSETAPRSEPAEVSPMPPGAGLDTAGGDRYGREIRLAWLFLVGTLALWSALSLEMGAVLLHRIEDGTLRSAVEEVVFILILQGMMYGNLVYQLTRLAYLRRRRDHRPTPADARERLYEGRAPSLAILVPSYKEELAVVRRTLFSAALQDCPNRRVILLVDDPPDPSDPGDRQALAAVRRLPQQLQALFDAVATPFAQAREDFLVRRQRGEAGPGAETARLARLYRQAADAVEALAATHSRLDHADSLLYDQVFARAAGAHRARARDLALGDPLGSSRLAREYRRLSELFRVQFSSFERKRYVNLSREPNKAMNLNSYIGLMGKAWQVVVHDGGCYLEPAAEGMGFAPPAADFLLTLDADSILVPEYASTLVYEMLRPGNERLAVAQTPYNAIPGSPGALERLAGATTDIQYLIHQGFTRYGATYWVGANALLRMTALQDIKEEVEECGFKVPIFIQDRTVIEDTESSVDLVARGWALYNHPERLAFSATPPDFGSLLIQRRRWANGGLIILPKLLRYLGRTSLSGGKLAEGFFRGHYLVSLAVVNAGLLLLLAYPFENTVIHSWLMWSTLVPYFLLSARDLRYSGYGLGDLWRICALNLMLLPVSLGGVLKSLHQACTGQRIPFGRTPKVTGRTAAPAVYVVAEYGLLTACIAWAVVDGWQHRWNSAAFHTLGAVLLAYAILAFIGLKASWEDMRNGFWQLVRATVPASRPATLVKVPAGR